MALEKWSPYRDLHLLQNRFNRLFDNFFDREIDTGSDLATQWYPPTSIYETKERYIVKMDIPGIRKSDLHIEFRDGTLVISGERKLEKEFSEDQVYRSETVYGNFSRSFLIPKHIEPNRIDAGLKDGVLTLTIPKAEESKPKSIPIK